MHPDLIEAIHALEGTACQCLLWVYIDMYTYLLSFGQKVFELLNILLDLFDIVFL
jgi:hypothetical protein